MTHTPGPWQFVPHREIDGYSVLWNPETRQEVLATGGKNQADHPITSMGEELTEDDKALIEAAPELLAALRNCVDYWPSALNDDLQGRTHEEARVAVAKAAGESAEAPPAACRHEDPGDHVSGAAQVAPIESGAFTRLQGQNQAQAETIRKLVEALQPFADFADPRRKAPDSMTISAGSAMAKRQLAMGDCYRAREALKLT